MLSDGDGAGFEAWVEGKNSKIRLNEHQVRHQAGNDGGPPYTECFLETNDEPFRIKIQKSPSTHGQSDYRCRAYVDGTLLGPSVWRSENESMGWDHIYQKSGGEHFSVSLQFSPISDEVTLDLSKMKSIGNIELVLEKGAFRFKRRGRDSITDLVNGTADEKSKKGTIPEKTEESQVDYYTFIPSKRDKHFYRFVFKYRPRVVLVQTRIIDEPEIEDSATAPMIRPKRKRYSGVIDMVDTDEEKVKEEEEEEEDTKPNIKAKRIKYLEDQVRLLSSENKQLREGGSSIRDPVDLTFDEDD
ncbi:uncharacterized protein IL334_002687 [Kwoniella shivajii]|uniref:NADH:ubiquinone oxidoreductase intermediate-associated protein 30 domain-containing protein n=1 Tax=Kwoniella shivajii TaxID=564305 RepID=A0ABZ1CVF5_9TREE|nr:hypothetical protein IL334_002687 [Kwoniella shivajii]